MINNTVVNNTFFDRLAHELLESYQLVRDSVFSISPELKSSFTGFIADISFDLIEDWARVRSLQC